MKGKYLVFSLLAVILIFSSCKMSNKQLHRLQEMETGVSSPTTVEELEDAIQKYSQRVEDVTSANAQIGVWYKMIASRYLDRKMYGEALKNYQKAIEFYPTNQNLYYWVGVCAGFMAQSSLDYEGTGYNSQKMNYYRLAESAYKQAIKIDGRFTRPMYGISVLYILELDESEKAIPYLEKLLTIDTKNTDAMLLLARAYYTQYDFERAVEIYDDIIKVTKSEIRKAEAANLKAQVLETMYN
ncbi:MAG: tetratricopeptide repeat protein [Treponemataceae bacterium]|nr:tetratricopeptide repeat protein [Treponemataceae bacterium]